MQAVLSMKRYRLFHVGLVSALLLFVGVSNAQNWQVELADAEVIAAKDPFAAVTERPDSLLLRALPATSLGDLLQLSTTLNLRSYGPPGTLISGAGRGLPADHLVIYWMGVPMNSPSLGMVDLSAIPSSLFGTPLIQSGNRLSRSQSGGAAGAIHLSQGNEERHAVGSGYDDLNNLRNWARLVFHPAEGLKLSTRYQRERAQNRFTFNDPFLFGNPERRQEHNGFKRDALIQELTYAPNERWSFETGVWVQQSALEIPDIMGKLGEAQAAQRDSSIRAIAAITHYTRFGRLNTRLARFSEHMHYTYRANQDAPISINSEISTHRNFAQLGWSNQIGRFNAEVFADASLETAHSANHGVEGAKRALYGAQSRVSYTYKKWRVNTGARYDVGPGANMPVPEADVERETSIGNLRVGGRRIFRYPDLNQLFWQPGGDSNLHPELGEAFDVSINNTIAKGRKSIRYNISVYQQNMQSLIMWTNDGTGLQARNLRSVESRGVQAQVEGGLPAGRMEVRQSVHVNFQQNEGLGALDERFFPMLQARYGLSLARGAFSVGVATRYISESWTPQKLNATSGRQDATLLFDAHASADLELSKTVLRLSTLLRNLGDVMDYRITQVATPGRVISINIEWLF